MYDRILVAIDAAPDAPDDSLQRLTQFAKMTGGTVHLLHVARGHVVAYDINAGSGLGVLAGEEDVAANEQKIVQDAVNQLATGQAGGLTDRCPAGPSAWVMMGGPSRRGTGYRAGRAIPAGVG